MILDLVFGVRRAIVMGGWMLVGMWIGSMFWYADVCMPRTVPPEHLLDCLLYEAGLWVRLYPLSFCLHVDLTCLCLVFEGASICGEGYEERMCCRSSIVVCIPMVFSVRAVMVGWV